MLFLVIARLDPATDGNGSAMLTGGAVSRAAHFSSASLGHTARTALRNAALASRFHGQLRCPAERCRQLSDVRRLVAIPGAVGRG
jgi:hypothetical protein